MCFIKPECYIQLSGFLLLRYMLNIDHNGMMWNMSDTGWAKAAWTSLFAPWIRGACIFIHNSDKFDPERTLQVHA